MASALKDQFGKDIPQHIAAMLYAVMPTFDKEAFLCQCFVGYEAMELTQRAKHIARQMATFLPEDFEQATSVILASLNVPVNNQKAHGMETFLFMPHVYFVAEFGINHFDAAMKAQYELTQRFTAEFSIRAYLDAYPEKTLAMLTLWSKDQNYHVRRLVSEGTRPRLPWAPRLKQFQRDPEPVITLLENLKDDSESYVRRSVANNLNDISKDHPERVNQLAKQWLKNANQQRKWVVKHGLRSLIKQGNLNTLALLGYTPSKHIELSDIAISPAEPKLGDSISIQFSLNNNGTNTIDILVDYIVHYKKANGTHKPKVFKLAEKSLAANDAIVFKKTLSLKPLTTRQHYLGEHPVSIVVNGMEYPIGQFSIIK